MTFRTTLKQAGKTATGIEVPPEVVAGLGKGKKPPVVVTLDGGHSYRSTIAPRGERFLLSVSAENREKAGVSAGDQIEVTLELDTQPRELVVPEDFSAALDASPAARAAFDAMSYSRRQRHVLSVEGAKAAETRARRIAKSVSDLAAGRG
jgi:hypothetical protein